MIRMTIGLAERATAIMFGHSQKPEIAYQIIERLYPNTNKLELFARNKRKTLFETWDVWGNAIKNDITL